MRDGARGRAFLDGPSRLQGIDLARALAVLGMFAAHLIALPQPELREPLTWIGLAGGRSSILFATLAGASLALITGGPAPITGPARATARLRILVRAALLWILGIALILTGVPVYVILPAYALLFALALPLLGLRARTLWVLTGVGALILPWLQPVWNALPLWQGTSGGDLALLLGWHYPFTLWIVFLIAGLAIGRSPLRALRTQVWLLIGGMLAVGLSVTGGALVPVDEDDTYFGLVWTAVEHSGGLLEVIGSGGAAVATIGACLLLCRTPISVALLPLRAVGAMPLTAYVGQLVAWAAAAALLLGDVGDLAGFRALAPFWPFVTVTVVVCTTWALLVGRGPLEQLVAACARRLVRAPRIG
ncbi:acyltransferase [Microbacterium sp.]|uniref:acyltransferase n=1 Tax=Microbacterium sp. TaxID=51671 RepID=UPI0025FA01C9|nr:acyltransferase [Microbacterium sp.]